MKKEVLDRLEEKARRAVDLLAELREENQRLSRQVEEIGAAGDDGRHDRMQEQIRLLQQERDAVRKRVEGLIRLLEESL